MAIEPRNSGLNLAEWMRRMGIKGRDQPGVSLGDVQLVQVVGNSEGIVPPLNPPMGLAGGSFTPGGAAFFAAQIRSKAAGGIVILSMQVSRGTAVPWIFRVGAPLALTISQPGVVGNLSPDPVVSTVEVGEVAALNLGATNPGTVSAAAVYGGPLVGLVNLFVPAGQSFYLESSTVATANAFWILWREYQRAAPPP